MSEEIMTNVLQMISAAGAARSKYMEAVHAAKQMDFKRSDDFITEGGTCFSMAHDIHAGLLSSAAGEITAGGDDNSLNLILVHAEDQMMCAEMSRLMSEELIDVYKKIQSQM